MIQRKDEYAVSDDYARQFFKRDDAPTPSEEAHGCCSVEYADEPVILTGPGGEYLHAEHDIEPMGWPMAVALAFGVGVSIYAAGSFVWWLVS